MKKKLYIPLIYSWIVALKWNAFANQPACAIDYTRRVAGVWWKSGGRIARVLFSSPSSTSKPSLLLSVAFLPSKKPFWLTKQWQGFKWATKIIKVLKSVGESFPENESQHAMSVKSNQNIYPFKKTVRPYLHRGHGVEWSIESTRVKTRIGGFM